MVGVHRGRRVGVELFCNVAHLEELRLATPEVQVQVLSFWFMNTTGLTQFITGWRGYILGARPQWYPHQRVEGIRAGWLIAGGAHQVAQFKRVATLLGTLFTGGAKLWVYGFARFHLGGVRPRREADYQDRPGQHPWGRS